jgi:exoribonuclease R
MISTLPIGHYPGILLIGKTYGRSKSNANSKFYYKCIPHAKTIPPLLIPYEQKNLGFNKNVTNRYVLFKFIEWEDKHPIGRITDNLGPVNDLNSFYEYHLHCKNLVISIKEFTNTLKHTLKHHLDPIQLITNILHKNLSIENRLNHSIITIDPINSTDLDDAMSFQNNTLSIYIANVPLLIDELGLWNSFSDRISTIYLPTAKRQMLPPLLSENLCSLLENEQRFALCMDITFNDQNDQKDQIDIKFSNALVKVRKNYDYEDTSLFKDKDYCQILNAAQILCKKYKYLKEINNSHDLVAYLMILMNIRCANKMCEFKDGIFRTMTMNKTESSLELSPEIADFIKIWQSSSGQYSNYDERKPHDLIASGTDYIHITSPIRRLVDLLNIIKLQEKLYLASWSSDTIAFYTKWLNKLEYINTSMKAIRKVQIDCNILHLCVSNPAILEKIYNGYIFDEQPTEDQFQYTVYIPKIKIITRIKTKIKYKEYDCHQFKLYLIEDGMTLKRKIRAEIIN